jgi:hypothetical protein
MATALKYFSLALLPTAIFAVAAQLLDPRTPLRQLRLRRPTRDIEPGLYPPEPIERLSDDLRRVAADLERIERTNPPAKVARLRAASMAYDDLLLAACRALEVPTQNGRPPLDAIERLETEAELARQGFTW